MSKIGKCKFCPRIDSFECKTYLECRTTLVALIEAAQDAMIEEDEVLENHVMQDGVGLGTTKEYREVFDEPSN